MTTKKRFTNQNEEDEDEEKDETRTTKSPVKDLLLQLWSNLV